MNFTTAEVREHLIEYKGVLPSADVLKMCDALDAANAKLAEISDICGTYLGDFSDSRQVCALVDDISMILDNS